MEPETRPAEPDTPQAEPDTPQAEPDTPIAPDPPAGASAEPAAVPAGPSPGRRPSLPVALGVLAVVVVLSLLVGVLAWNVSRSHHPAQASGSHPAAADVDGCRWWTADPAAKRYQRGVGIPPHSRTHRTGTHTMKITTALGPIVVRMDSAKTPCTVASFAFLAGRHFFDGTACHRLVTQGIYILQCGDPSGTGRGGPGYAFADELTRADPLPSASAATGTPGLVTYKRGTVALANSGRDANGSQFFIVYRDSPIPPQFTPFGTVESGMGVVDDVAAAGDDEADAPDPGGGHPKLPLTVTSLTVG